MKIGVYGLAPLGAAAIVTTGLIVPAIAQTQPTPTPAPQGLIGQCRAVNKPTPVYRQASTTGGTLGTLATNTKVTLADNGSNGFIGISQPLNGYVQTANLKTCPETPPQNTCRRVIYPPNGGLNIRKSPDINSALVGGAPYMGRVYLKSAPPVPTIDPSNRVWVEIVQPVNGWVSNGFKGGNSNLGYCP